VKLLVQEHYRFVWRLLRWLGVQESELDDKAQEVFLIAARRLSDIESGRERGFLAGVATRKAAAARRAMRARPESVALDQVEPAANHPLPDAQLETQQAQVLLCEVLDSMAEDLRTVFCLFELEEVEIPEIACMLSIPVGTVGSRLRRARAEFSQKARLVRARHAWASRGGSL
jgi:RNA polymerase sigma-70 factor, ECF subfamily